MQKSDYTKNNDEKWHSMQRVGTINHNSTQTLYDTNFINMAKLPGKAHQIKTQERGQPRKNQKAVYFISIFMRNNSAN